jgi:benzoyl-CoA reductase/2-hydroxyglutaryl-CoA dehydratase subunit BcrC/BadD/HgdB
VGALAELQAAARERFARAAEARAGGERVVGYVGADVPQELIEAAGFLPLRLAPAEVASRARADRLLGPGVDEPLRLVLAGLLEGRYPVDLVVVCHDSDHTVRLYTALRALALRESLPPLHFHDFLHLPKATTAAYDRDRVGELAAVLADLAGRPLDGAALAAAVAEANESRRLLRRVDALRRAGALRGSELLAVVAAGTAMRAAELNALLRALLAEPPAPGAAPARRVYLLGSPHDAPDLYEALEATGAAVVGESHTWGSLWFDGLVDEAGDPLRALAARHHLGSALGRRHDSVERARRAAADAAAAGAGLALAWHRAADEGLAWALPEEERAFAARGIPLVALRGRPYRLDDDARAALAGAVAA